MAGPMLGGAAAPLECGRGGGWCGGGGGGGGCRALRRVGARGRQWRSLAAVAPSVAAGSRLALSPARLSAGHPCEHWPAPRRLGAVPIEEGSRTRARSSVLLDARALTRAAMLGKRGCQWTEGKKRSTRPVMREMPRGARFLATITGREGGCRVAGKRVGDAAPARSSCTLRRCSAISHFKDAWLPRSAELPAMRCQSGGLLVRERVAAARRVDGARDGRLRTPRPVRVEGPQRSRLPALRRAWRSHRRDDHACDRAGCGLAEAWPATAWALILLERSSSRGCQRGRPNVAMATRQPYVYDLGGTERCRR